MDPDYLSDEGRTRCAHGRDIAGRYSQYDHEGETTRLRMVARHHAAATSRGDRTVHLGTSRGGTTWWLDTRDGGGCVLALAFMLLAALLVAGAYAWLLP